MWPENKDKDKKKDFEIRYRNGTLWFESDYSNIYIDSEPITQEKRDKAYIERLKENQLDKEIRAFIESITMESKYGESNTAFVRTYDGQTKVMYRDKRNNIRQLTYNIKNKKVASVPQEHTGRIVMRLLTKEELKFFDKLGFTLTDTHTEITQQLIEDWWSM